MKKLLTILFVLIAAVCTAFAFGACDLFAETDDGENASESGSGNSSSGNNSSSGGNTSGGNFHTCVFVFTEKVDGCVTNGYDLYTCKDPACGKTEKQNSYAPVGHDYKHKTFTATCTSDWSEADICSRCGDERNRKTVAGTKTGHSYAWTETKSATCTADGIKTGTCSDCGATDTQPIPANGHNYGEYVSDSNATCGKDGTKTAICAVCGDKDVLTDAGTATGRHVFGEYKSNNDGNCQKDCTGTASCTVCGVSDTKTLTGTKGSHDYIWTVKEKTCNTRTESGVCKLCYDVTEMYWMMTDVWCDYSGPVKTKAATCTEEGYKGASCVKCGHVNKTETYPALGHNLNGEGVCTRCGEEVGVCSWQFEIAFKTLVEGDFGTVYFEVVVLNPEYRQQDNGLWVMKYSLYAVQTYFLDGEMHTNRVKVDLNRPDGIGSTFSIKLFRLSDRKEIILNGAADYSVDPDVHWIYLMVSGSAADNDEICHFQGGREWQYPEQ